MNYKITKPIRLIELFGGIGTQALGLKYAGIPFEHWKLVEFDKYCIKSYNAIHGTNFEPLDITKVTAKDLDIRDTDKYEYVLTFSFPCTDLSLAGLQEGMDEGSGTRSSLLWEVKRILEECENLPKILLMENVTQVHGSKNMKNFKKFCDFLSGLGYYNTWMDMNASDYGVAQNRDRCFMVSILKDGENIEYHFPEKEELDKTMYDYLEEETDERYFINPEKSKKLIDDLISSGRLKEFL